MWERLLLRKPSILEEYLYYYFLDHFTVEELEGQLQRLRAIHQQMLVGTEKDAPGKRGPGLCKGRRVHAAAAKEKEEEMYQQGEAEAGTKVQKQAADHHEADHQGGKRIKDLNSGACTLAKDGSMWCAARACGTLRFATGNAGGSGAQKVNSLNCPYG